jgi:tripartite-type tricarboxylate transporter receptor subunit TctC
MLMSRKSWQPIWAAITVVIAVIGFGLSWMPAAHAGEADRYPSRPVRIINPFQAGGLADVTSRLIGAKLQASLGQPFVVESRPGATGAVGTIAVARATPDGYTLLFTSNSAHVMNPLLYNPMPFEPVKDFAAVSMAVRYPFYLLSNPALPVKSVSDLVALAKAKPGKLNVANFGQGSGSNLVATRFKNLAGIDVVHVSYKGVPAMQQAVMTGEADYMVDSIGASQPLVADGRLRGLAVTGAQRSPALPDIPTLAEIGFPGFDAQIWLGFLAPAGTPQPIVDKLQRAIADAVAQPDVRERILAGGSEPVGGTPQALARAIADEVPVWTEVIATNHITAD